MPVNSITYNFDDLLTTTWMNYRSKLYDNIFNACPFFYWLHANERKRIEPGGERIVIPLEYGKNSTIKSMSSGYDTIDTTPQESMTDAYYTWKEIAGSTSISNKELAMNQGKHKILDLLQKKANNTEMSFTEIIEQMIVGAITAGNGGSDLTPINLLIKGDPTTSTTVGGINQSTYSWWQNRYKVSSATTYEGFIKEVVSLYNQCSRGGTKNGKRKAPDCILCDQGYYEVYLGAARAKGQIMLTNEPTANLGFGGAKYLGATLLWDEYVPDITTGVANTAPDSHTYNYYSGLFINSEFLEFVVCSGQDFTVGPFIQPENQKAKTSILYLMGEICCSNRAKQGVHRTVVKTITA
jgi:hypothetical protein